MLMTTLCYIEHKGHLLLLHRDGKPDDINEGKWIGVGGKFLDRESPEECLLREVREETGYGLTSWRFRGVVTFLQENYETEFMCLYTSDDFLVPADDEFVTGAAEEVSSSGAAEEVSSPGAAEEVSSSGAAEEVSSSGAAEEVSSSGAPVNGAPAGRRLFDRIPVDLHPAFSGKEAGEWPVPDCSEGTLAWIPKEKIRDLPMWEGDRIFFDLIEQDRPFFSLRLEYSGEDLVSASLDGKPL